MKHLAIIGLITRHAIAGGLVILTATALFAGVGFAAGAAGGLVLYTLLSFFLPVLTALTGLESLGNHLLYAHLVGVIGCLVGGIIGLVQTAASNYHPIPVGPFAPYNSSPFDDRVNVLTIPRYLPKKRNITPILKAFFPKGFLLFSTLGLVGGTMTLFSPVASSSFWVTILFTLLLPSLLICLKAPWLFILRWVLTLASFSLGGVLFGFLFGMPLSGAIGAIILMEMLYFTPLHAPLSLIAFGHPTHEKTKIWGYACNTILDVKIFIMLPSDVPLLSGNIPYFSCATQSSHQLDMAEEAQGILLSQDANIPFIEEISQFIKNGQPQKSGHETLPIALDLQDYKALVASNA